MFLMIYNDISGTQYS